MNTTERSEYKEKQKTYSRRTAVLIVFISLISFRLLLFLPEYISGSELVTMSYKDFVNADSKNEWLEITNVQADLLQSVYEEDLFSNKEYPEAVYIPLISKDTTYYNAELKLLIYTDEGPLYNTFINLFYSGDSGYPEKEHDDYIWHVEGPFQGYLMNIDTKKNELRDALPNLAEYFYVLEEGAKFPYLAVLFLFVILLMLIIFLINTYKKQKTLRFQLKK